MARDMDKRVRLKPRTHRKLAKIVKRKHTTFDHAVEELMDEVER